MAMSRFPGNDVQTLVGRLLIAAIFVTSGVTKLVAPAATIRYFASVGLPAPWLTSIGSILLELACGTMFMLGYRTRVIAWVLAIYCVATAVIFHHAFSDQNQLVNFLKNLAIAGGLLAMSVQGAGAFSIDRLISRPSHAVPSTFQSSGPTL